jgi:transposase
MKKVYTAAFKAQVVLELLKEEKTVPQISTEYAVHPNVVREWRTQALKGLPTLFERRDDLVAVKAAHAQQVEDLYAEIGRLTTQLNWLKKRLPASLIASDER